MAARAKFWNRERSIASNWGEGKEENISRRILNARACIGCLAKGRQ
jgi:hypothetical protein